MKNICAILKFIIVLVFIFLCDKQVQSQNVINTILVGDTAVFTITGINGNIQWQQSNDSLSWFDIPNANSNPQTIILTSSQIGLRFFRAIINGSGLCSSHNVISSIIKYKVINNTMQVLVGDRFHGGIVFFIDSIGGGLIAPLNDLGKYSWGCLDFVTNATSTTDGAINTTTILNNCSERPIAASVCDTANLNEYSDWFLPSSQQLTYLYQNRLYFGSFSDDNGGFGGYWSSTELDGHFACNYWFDVNNLCCGCSDYSYSKANHKSVRCIRSFNLNENNGKIYSNSLVSISPVYENEEICCVTVDTSVNRNKIIYQKIVNVGIESYKIYKETGLNEYSLVGNVQFDQPSFFIDNNSLPESHGDKYKISVVDTCGQESALSYFHKTINLTIAVNGTTMGLNWDDYIDESGVFVPSKFYIYRGSNIHNLSLYDSISASFHSYNDVNIVNSYYYMIGIKKNNGCTISKSIFNMVFSNKKQNYVNGVNEIRNSYCLKIYPNPFDKLTTINLDNSNHRSRDWP